MANNYPRVMFLDVVIHPINGHPYHLLGSDRHFFNDRRLTATNARRAMIAHVRTVTGRARAAGALVTLVGYSVPHESGSHVFAFPHDIR